MPRSSTTIGKEMLFALWILSAACTGSIGSLEGTNPRSGGGPALPGAENGNGSQGAAPGLNDPVDPGATLMRRLTNAEYARTVTDLLGEPAGADERLQLPEDPRTSGFDNNAEVETISTVHADRYAQGAESLTNAVLASPERRALVFGCDPSTGTACLQTFIQRFGRRVYRRPLSADEVSGYLKLASAAGTATLDGGPSAVLQAMLRSPYFLFRVELGQPDPARAGLLRLTGFEVATRLSYLLWGTTPDDPLLDSAQKGDLDTPAGLDGIASKMLADPRAKPAVTRFYTQWMQFSDLGSVQIDANKFKMYSPALASAMAEETTRFVDSVIWDNQAGASMLNLLSARYTFVNGPLAALYGLPAGDNSWRRVDFADNVPRIGMLTHPSVLTLTSHSDGISPTKRGLYVREVLLCQEMPPPPPGVDATLPQAKPGETERERFSRHTTDTVCASCHSQMDPIGWGLSQFDAIGALSPGAVDVAGRIEGMTPPEFNGPLELAQRVRESADFAACVGTSMYRYAYGLRETPAHAEPILQVQRAFRETGFNFGKTLLALVHSDAFRYRRLP
jgi:hypothetical protein